MLSFGKRGISNFDSPFSALDEANAADEGPHPLGSIVNVNDKRYSTLIKSYAVLTRVEVAERPTTTNGRVGRERRQNGGPARTKKGESCLNRDCSMEERD